jgi:two-component system, cell cycle response regulator DivK
MPHGPEPTVLLIETDTSLRRLIALGLQYRGMHVIEASSPASLPTVEAREPDLLLLDIDGNTGSNWSLLDAVQSHPYLSTLPVVVLAWECPVPAGAAREVQSQLQTYTTFLSKPFDARALYTTLESLLAAVSSAQAKTQSQEVALLRQGKDSSSIWPLLTAAGLLLTFIGLMGLLALSAVGLCVLLVSLLWWTLGSSIKKEAVAI